MYNCNRTVYLQIFKTQYLADMWLCDTCGCVRSGCTPVWSRVPLFRSSFSYPNYTIRISLSLRCSRSCSSLSVASRFTVHSSSFARIVLFLSVPITLAHTLAVSLLTLRVQEQHAPAPTAFQKFRFSSTPSLPCLSISLRRKPRVLPVDASARYECIRNTGGTGKYNYIVIMHAHSFSGP